MNSRERVLTALRHERPDRTPCDFWAEPPTWSRLLAHAGYSDRDQLLDALAIDVRHLAAPAPPERPVVGDVLQNFWGERFVYLLISDLGSQRGPLISLPMFREFVAPYLKEMIDCIHGLNGQVLFHSCGLIRPFIPELIELGVDVLDPIQPVTAEMQPESLKSAFGQNLSFHGGLDMQHLLPQGTPAEVAQEAWRYCEVLGQNGGYILAPAHLFQPAVPPENIFSLYELDWRSPGAGHPLPCP
jgi:hypothetical protein